MTNAAKFHSKDRSMADGSREERDKIPSTGPRRPDPVPGDPVPENAVPDIQGGVGMSGVEDALREGGSRETAEERWERAGIGNAFIFGKVMSGNPDLLLEFLQLALPGLEIRELVDPLPEASIKTAFDSRGVRLDIKVRDVKGRVYNVEMQLRDEKNVQRRIRYYSSTLDGTILKPGEDYSRLSDTVVLFITTFDPFERGRIRYTFRNICVEDKELELGDGTTKMILNASGSVPGNGRKKDDNGETSDARAAAEEEVSDELRGFLELVMGTRPPEDAGTFAGRVQKGVDAAKRDSATRREFMNWEMTLTVERNKGREEGRKEGIEEGRDEGDLLRLIKLAQKKCSKGYSLERIAEELEENPELIEPIFDVCAENPGAGSEIILHLLEERGKGTYMTP